MADSFSSVFAGQPFRIFPLASIQTSTPSSLTDAPANKIVSPPLPALVGM